MKKLFFVTLIILLAASLAFGAPPSPPASTPTAAQVVGQWESGSCTGLLNSDGTCKAIGTNVQAYDAELTALAGLTSAANAIPYFTGSGTAGVISSSADMVALLGSDSYATARTNLGLAIGTNVQAQNADLDTLAAGGTANCLWGEKSDSSGLECKSTINIQMDDSAAQFKDATDATKTFQVELGSIATGTKRTMTIPNADFIVIGKDTTDTVTNKTLDVDGTGNVVKSWGYLILSHPHLCAAGAPMQTTSTANTYGQCKYGNATDKATNYAEYYLVVPADIDTSVDLVGTFKVKLGGADTGDHEYEISFDSVADSAAYVGSLGDAVSLAYTADAAGADADVETATGTLTGWRAAMTAGQLFVIRVARDGDHANDGSTVDSFSGPLVIKYKISQ